MADTNLIVKTPEMLNALTNKFVDLEGLKVFWANAKSYVDTQDAELQEQIDNLKSGLEGISVAEGSSVENYVTLSVEGTDGAYTIATDDSALVTEFAAVRKEISDGDAATLEAAKAYTGKVAGEYSKTEGDATTPGTGLRGEFETAIKAEEAARIAADEALGKRIDDIVADAKTYAISKVTENLGENVKEAFQLVDEDGTPCGETINIYKDSSLINVELVAEDADSNAGQFLKYTYVLANGTEKTEYVNVSQFLVEAEFKNGLEVSAAGEVSVKIDATSESFLTVSEAGVKLSGVQDAIDNSIAAIEFTFATHEDIDGIFGVTHE